MIEGFVRLLRERNIRVGIAETIDACKAFSLLEIDKEVIREGLAACLIKDEIDRPDFDHIFNLYFCNLVEESKKTPPLAPTQKGEYDPSSKIRQEQETEGQRQEDTQQPHTQRQDQQMQQGVLARYGGIRGIGKAIDENDLEGAADQLLERILKKSRDPDTFTKMLKNFIEYMKLYAGWAVEDTADFEEYVGRINEVLNITQRKFIDLFREEYPLEELISKLVKLDYENIEELDFNKYVGDLTFLISNVEKIEKTIKKLARQLASKLSRREKISDRGKINIRKSIRKSIEYGGVLAKLEYKMRKVQKPEIILLCDVSGSCEWISDFFITLMLGIKKAFTEVKGYIFTDHCWAVTKALDTGMVDRLFQEISHWWDFYRGGGSSNMETAFEDFLKKTQGDITKKTSVIILSDCRDYLGSREVYGNLRGYPRSAYRIAKLSKMSKRLMILNPEEPRFWNTGDSVVDYYVGEGAECYPVKNLQELANMVILAAKKDLNPYYR
ncbi:MAG: VWA domain-containing protein [Candidatus Jordarchaeum sp.]|uniref:VWA domain-containing protein n=1 Tax=Candidatus Jordarchaeum sp. TaxID=2823881 RepID=UPI00404B4688